MNDYIVQLDLVPGKHCFYSTIYNLLQYHKINIDEYKLFFLADGLQYSYEKQTSFTVENSRIHDIGSPTYDTCLKNISQAICGTQYGLFHIEYSGEILIEHAKQYQQPIMMMVYSEILTYHKLRDPLNQFHCILLLGLDCAKGVAYIGDSYNIDSNGEVYGSRIMISLELLLCNMVAGAWVNNSVHNFVSSKIMLKKMNQSLNRIHDHYFAGLSRYVEDIILFCQQNPKDASTCMIGMIYNLKVCIIFYLDYCVSYLELLNSKEKLRDNLLAELEDVKASWNRFILYLVKELEKSKYIKFDISKTYAIAERTINKHASCMLQISSYSDSTYLNS